MLFKLSTNQSLVKPDDTSRLQNHKKPYSSLLNLTKAY